MAKNYYRKPIPKSQKELSKGLKTPYDHTMGDPNEASGQDQFSPDNQANIPFNRSEKISFRGDTSKPFSIGIKDIDESIMYYFNEVIKPFVIQNGERISVPIIYGSPERWKSMQRDSYYRDKKGAIMMPILMFKRDSLSKNRKLSNKLDANNPNLYTSWQKSYNSKNLYSNFGVLNNRVPTKQFIANVIPDWVDLTYSCIVQTYYVEQLNKIIEAINYASDSYWGNPDRFKFRARIDNFTTVTELQKQENRVVKGTFEIKMYGYIVPDVIQKDLNSIKKYNNKSKILFSMETDSTSQRYESNPTSTPDGRTTEGIGNIRLEDNKSSFFPSLIETPSNPNISINDLPTSDPEIEGALWSNNGTPEVSKGPMA
tara:strand:+ start:1882 stop:2994 length:1113 start_codon:yes stop_codon:yes gene_type:complete